MPDTGPRLRAWLKLAWMPGVRMRALRTAAFIGTLLALINHGDALLSGHLAAGQYLRIALTYVVPYCVATWSSVQTTKAIANSEQGKPRFSCGKSASSEQGEPKFPPLPPSY